jgi:hypothetical protein
LVAKLIFTKSAKIRSLQGGMALRKGKIVEAAGMQRSACAGEKEEVLGIAFGDLEIPLCTLAPLPLEYSYAAYSSA